MYRILAVIDPENTTGWAPSEAVWKNIIYQQQRGEIAIGSGGIFGNGLFGGRYYSVPNAHNDFILSWIAILPVLWAAAWCWACCSRWWSRPLPPVPAAKTCWAATSVPASAVPDGSDRGERSMNCACCRSSASRCPSTPPAQFGADAVHLRRTGALGLQSQHQKPVRLTGSRSFTDEAFCFVRFLLRYDSFRRH